MKKVFVIIVSYNGGQKFIKATRLVKLLLSENESVNLIIVDNASKDGSIKKIKKIVCPFRLLQNKKNLGFARAINQGAREAIKNGADRILLLNQDVYIRNKDFRVLVESQNNIVSPVIKFERRGKSVYDMGGMLNRLIMRPYHLEESSKPNRIYKIDYVSGCCMLVDSFVFKKIGYFDESFFLYFEDVDFCLKASGAGFNVAVEPNAEIFHDLAEREKKTIGSIYNLVRSHLIFINKWAKFPSKTVAFLYWFFISFKILFSKLIFSVFEP